MRPLAIALAAASALIFLAVPAAAQKIAQDEVGFNAEKLYDFDGIDSVALFNGNLTVTLPLATYRVSSTLSYQLSLIYNGKHTDTESYDCQAYSGDDWTTCYDFVPSRQSNVGWGWRISLGRLLEPWQSPHPNGSFSRFAYIYEGPAGDEHTFNGDANADGSVILSHDPQPLRMVRLSATLRKIEFPDGTYHLFSYTNSAWRLVSMHDRFGNSATVTYTYTYVNGKYREATWTITDTQSRSHTVTLSHHTSLASTWSLGQNISSLSLQGFGGATTTYGISYTQCNGTSVPQKVSLPDGTTYQFAYNTDCALQTLTLPTGGTHTYEYTGYTFAVENDVCASGPPTGYEKGLRSRMVSDGTTTRTWDYIQRRGPKVPVTYYDGDPVYKPCDPYESYGPVYWSRTTVLAPMNAAGTRTRTDNYFSIFGEPPYPNADEHPFVAANDLPFGYPGVAGRPPDDRAAASPSDDPVYTLGWPDDVNGSDGGNRFLATRTYEACDADGVCETTDLARSTYVRHGCLDVGLVDNPNQCWEESSRLVYETDRGCGTACYTQTTLSGRTNAGMFATTTIASNFPDPGTTCTAAAPCAERQVAQTYTAYPAWPTADAILGSKPWITGTFTEQSRTEGSTTAKSLFQFSASTGALEGVRTVKGLAMAGDDLLTVYAYDAAGNRTDEKSYGGDCPLTATQCGDCPPGDPNCAGLDTTSCCTAPAAGLQYYVHHTYLNNAVTKSEYLDPTTCMDVSQGTCTSLLITKDLVADKWTRLVTLARDSAGVASAYDYYADGRLKTVTPTGAASRSYVYTASSATATAKVVETSKSTAGQVLGTSTYELDGLGRLRRISTPRPDGTVATVQTNYDEEGRKAEVSQPRALSTHPTGAFWSTATAGTDWTTTAYDAFARPVAIRGPDSNSTTIGYVGERLRTRTAGVVMSASGTETNASTTETYDALGRLRRVEEASDGTSAASPIGATAATAYTYDVGGRLRTVTNVGGTQAPRTFTYDNRGFLLSEVHPESGTATFGAYDARGHAQSKTEGGRTLRLTYDAAERLVGIGEVVGTTTTPITEFVFAQANAGTNLTRGKLEKSVRHNVLPNAGAIDVTQIYDYATTSGALRQRTTLVERVNGSTRTTMQQSSYSMTYDDFLLPKTLTLPTCSAGGCTIGQGLASITFDRTLGFLTGVQGFGTLSYGAAGNVATVVHGSTPTATDTYATTHGLARPSTITFSGGTACPTPAPSTIIAPDVVCPNVPTTAYVAARAGFTHTWGISGAGAAITSSTTGDSITFVAGTASVTLTVTATNACQQPAPSTKTVAVPSVATPTITAPSSICGGATGQASVSATANVTYAWTIQQGTFTAPTSGTSTTGTNVTFVAGASGPVRLTVTATETTCNRTASAFVDVPIATAPTAQLTGDTTIVRGAETATLAVALTGTPPWRVEWSDGVTWPSVSSTSLTRVVAPNVTTTYGISVTSNGCTAAGESTATVNVIPPAPAAVTATTQTNRTVTLTWTPVTGTSSYLIERATRRDDAASWSTLVAGGASTYTDTVPASAQPVTYVYAVRAQDAYGALSRRGAWDFATCATTLYSQATIVAGSTSIRAADVAELRAAIDAFRASMYLPALFVGVSAPSGGIRASDFAALVTALNGARSAAGQSPFTYVGVPAPAPGGVVSAAHVLQLREALR